MPWSGGNYTKGNNGTGGWAGDQAAGIGIESGRHDTQDNDFATGINQCLNKDGSNAATGNLNAGGFKVTNVAAGTAAAPAICAGNDINTGIFAPAADEIGIANNGVERIRINATGQVGIGTTTPTEPLDIQSSTGTILATRFSNDASAPIIYTRKSRGATVGANTIVQVSDATGAVIFQGANGSGYTSNAAIIGYVDGTPGASNDMPGRLVFFTTPDGSGTLTERMRITGAGYVGIGTPSPSYKVQISQAVYDQGLAISGDGVNIGAFLHFLDNGTQRNVIHWDVGGFVSGSVNSLVARSGATGGVYLAQTGTSWIAVSDGRYKKNVQDLEYGLDEISQLRPVRFDYTDDETDNSSRLGFIAQEVQPLIPEVVQGSEELKLGLSLTELIPALVNSIKELNAKVEALEARVAELEA